MKQFKSKLKSNTPQVISWVSSMEFKEERFSLSLDIDEDSTPYEKSMEKSYSLLEKLYFQNSQYIFSVTLKDYGWTFNDEKELLKCVNDYPGGDLSYEISDVDSENCEVTLKGSIFADIMSVSYEPPVADLKYYALDSDVYKTLKIHEVLALEAFHLEEKRNHKLSLFTYFTAIEALVSQFIDDYKVKIHEELHHSLEHLDLDKKIRIIVREKFKEIEFESISIWGDFASTFKAVKTVRNNIAHGKNVDLVSCDDSFNALYSLLVLRAMLYQGATSVKDIRSIIFPKT